MASHEDITVLSQTLPASIVVRRSSQAFCRLICIRLWPGWGVCGAALGGLGLAVQLVSVHPEARKATEGEAKTGNRQDWPTGVGLEP